VGTKFVLFLFISYSFAIKGIYFVSPETGSSKNDGSRSSPFFSVADALNAPPGSNGVLVIELLEGTYTGPDNIGLVFNNPTEIRHTEDSKAIFDCNGGQQTVFTATSDFSVTSFKYNTIYFQNCAEGIRINGTASNQKTFTLQHLTFKDVTSAIYSTDVAYLHIIRAKFQNSMLTAIGIDSYDSALVLRACSFTGVAFDVEKYGHLIMELVTVEDVHTEKSPMNIQAEDIEISFLGVKNCSSSSSGGAMTLTGPGEVAMLAGQFDSCTTAGNGGAITMSQMTSTFENVRFFDCKASGNGGAVYDDSIGAEFLYYHVRFDSCSATYGGALDIEGRYFDNNFNNVVFTNNFASVNGSCAACCVNSPNNCQVGPIDTVDVYYMDNSGPGSLFTCEFEQNI